MSSKKALVKNLTLVDAALHVVEQVPETSLDVIETKMVEIYPAKCSFWALSDNEFVKCLSANQLAQLGEKGNGHSLWLKWKHMKREMINVAGPEWAKLVDYSGTV